MLAGHSRITSGDRFSLDSLFVDLFFFLEIILTIVSILLCIEFYTL